jgi:hypothetical protein
LSWGAWALFTSRECSKCGAANDLLCRHRFGDSRSELCGKASLAARLSSRSSSTIGRFSPPRGVGWALDSSLLLFGVLAVSRRHRGPHMNSRAFLEVRGEVGATDREPRSSA